MIPILESFAAKQTLEKSYPHGVMGELAILIPEGLKKLPLKPKKLS